MMERKSLRVLVTGHNGYIGSAMVPAIVSAGHQVAGIDCDFFRNCRFGPDTIAIPSLTLDVRDVTLEHLVGFDAIVHLAALANDPLGSMMPGQTMAINHAATVRLARLARDAGVRRFLYSSSCSLYGATGNDLLVNETAVMRPVSHYAVAKARAEEDLHELADDEFSPVYLRNATAYGSSPRLRTDLVINDLVVNAMLTGTARVLSDGTPWRPVVHVTDIARAFLAVLDAPTSVIHNRAFNVGSSDQNYRVRDLAAMVQDVVPGAQVVITGDHGPDPRSYRVDFTRLQTELPAAQPLETVRDSMAQLLADCRDHGITTADAEHRYKRMPYLRTELDAGRLGVDLRWLGARAAQSDGGSQPAWASWAKGAA